MYDLILGSCARFQTSCMGYISLIFSKTRELELCTRMKITLHRMLSSNNAPCTIMIVGVETFK